MRTSGRTWLTTVARRDQQFEIGLGSILRFTAREWQAFVLGVKDGEFE
jgi:hypothetical protein